MEKTIQIKIQSGITKMTNNHQVPNQKMSDITKLVKYCLLHILVPYLVNVKRLSPEEVSQVVVAWLSKCNTVNPLDFNPTAEIKNRIKHVKDFKPMSLSKLQTENMSLTN